MESLFSNILTTSFHGSVVIAAVILLRLALKKTPRKFICFLWLLAGLRLLMPFEIQSSLSLQPMPEVSQVQQWQTPQTMAAEESAPWETLPESAEQHQETQLPPVPENPISFIPTTNPTVERPQPTLNWKGAIPYVWLGVAACFGFYTVFAYLRLKYKVREAVKIPGGWECDRIETAFILGFVRPKIYIPMGLSPTVRKYVLAHERTHLEKGDHWIKMIGFLALALHWFNPLVWIAYILLCKDMELACDQRVVRFMDLEERKSYSAALLSCSTNRAHFAACPVAFGEVSVKDRIKMVLNYRRPGFWVSLLGVIAIAFVAVCLVTNPAREPDSPAQATDDQEQTSLETCYNVWNRLLNQKDCVLGLTGSNEYPQWQACLSWSGDDTLWQYTPTSSPDPISGRMEYNGKHYAYRLEAGWKPRQRMVSLRHISILSAGIWRMPFCSAIPRKTIGGPFASLPRGTRTPVQWRRRPTAISWIPGESCTSLTFRTLPISKPQRSLWTPKAGLPIKLRKTILTRQLPTLLRDRYLRRN